MHSNPYTSYYVNQAGSGIGGFYGARFQRGHGWFKTLWNTALRPLLQYLAPKFFSTTAKVASDAIGGENVVQSLKKHGSETMQQIANDAGDRTLKFVQTGKGRGLTSVKGKKRVAVKKRKAKKAGGRAKAAATGKGNAKNYKNIEKVLKQIPIFDQL